MNNSDDNLTFENPSFGLTKARHGYNPEEVDRFVDEQKEIINELVRQKEALQKEYADLIEVLAECNERIHRLSQSTLLLEQEREKEKQRIADTILEISRIKNVERNDSQLTPKQA